MKKKKLRMELDRENSILDKAISKRDKAETAWEKADSDRNKAEARIRELKSALAGKEGK